MYLNSIEVEGGSPRLGSIKSRALLEYFHNFHAHCITTQSCVVRVETVVHTGPKANTKITQTSRFTWFPKTGYVHGGSRLYINGGMIQTLDSTQYNPQKPVFHSYTRFSQIYTCTHSHSCIHLHSPLHSLCLLSSLFYLLSSVFSLSHTTLTALSISIYTRKKSLGSNPCAA